jgi:hypothetical protein
MLFIGIILIGIGMAISHYNNGYGFDPGGILVTLAFLLIISVPWYINHLCIKFLKERKKSGRVISIVISLLLLLLFPLGTLLGALILVQVFPKGWEDHLE